MKKYEIGDIVKGKVTGVEDYGIFLLIDSNVTGLIHISEISPFFVKNVADYAKIGDVLEAKVLEYDDKEQKMKLSIKDLVEETKKKSNGIVETKTGFSNLKSILNDWIDEKIENK